MALKTGEIIAIIIASIIVLSILTFATLKKDKQEEVKKTTDDNQLLPKENSNVKSNGLQQRYSVQQNFPISSPKAEQEDNNKKEQSITYNAIHRNMDIPKTEWKNIKTEKIALEFNNSVKGQKKPIQSQGQSFKISKSGKEADRTLIISLQSADNPYLITMSYKNNEQYTRMSFQEYRNQLQHLCTNLKKIEDINDPRALAMKPEFLGCKTLLNDSYFDVEEFKNFFNSLGDNKDISNRDIPILFVDVEAIPITMYMHDGDKNKATTIPCVNKNVLLKPDNTICTTANGTYKDKAKKMVLKLSGPVEFTKASVNGQSQYILSKITLGERGTLATATDKTPFTTATMTPNSITIENGLKTINNSSIISCLNAGHKLTDLDRD